VINRRQAVIGYFTYRLARRLALGEARRRAAGLRPAHRLHQGENMFRNSRGSAAAATDRAQAVVEAVRPIVTKPMHDPELHEAIRQAFNTGRDVQSTISGKKPSKAAKKLANDRKLHKRVETSANDLQKALSGLVEAPKEAKKGRAKRIIGRIAVIGAVAGGAVVLLRRFRGGGDDAV
jgi:hypothetical protein